MALDPVLLSQLLGVHPARRMAFEELRAGLQQGVASKCINLSRDGDLELYSYSRLCTFDQKWDLFSLMARGLILDVAAQRVVATPFPKFFNFGEMGLALPQEPFEVSEKIDGSLGILFHHNGRWRISTRGQLGSEQGAWATAYLNANVRTAALTPGVTYLTEIIYPANRIVISYDFEGLVLLAGYDEAGKELTSETLAATAAEAGMRSVRRPAYGSFDDLLAVAKQLTRLEEGFVVRFAGGLRVKLKGEAYCRVHKVINRCTPLAIWEAMSAGENLDLMRCELPEEMTRDFDLIVQLLNARLEAALDEIRAGHEKWRGLADKELGLMLQNPASELTLMQRAFIFACRKLDFFAAVRGGGEWREKIFRKIRPSGDVLEGYVPSDAMTRFEQEQG